MGDQNIRRVVLQTLTKELEAKAEVKVMVTGAAAQLLQLKERRSDGDPEDNGSPPPTASGTDVFSVNAWLRQVELDWSSLLVDVPVIQQTLHKVMTPPPPPSPNVICDFYKLNYQISLTGVTAINFLKCGIS